MRQRVGLVAAVIALAAVVYHGVFTAELLNWDDSRFLVDNPLYRGDVATYIGHALASVQFEAYQPVHLLSYLPDRLLWPDSSLGYHVLDFALFACLIAVLAQLAMRRASPLAACAAVALFALHPLVVEPVAWVTARKDLLAALLLLVALAREDRDAPRRWLAIACFVLALLTKSSAACFPVVLLAWLHWMKHLPWRAAAKRTLPYWPPALASAIAVAAIWSSHGMIAPLSHVRALDVPATFGIYAARVVAPVDLAPLYPEHAPIWAGIACLVAAALALALRKRLPPAARFVLVAFVAVLLPVSNVVPIARFADRYALFALAVCVPALALVIARYGRAALVVVALALVAEGWQSERQVATWHDSLALWQHSTAAQPDVLLAHLKLGETLRDAGRYNEAIAAYRAAIGLEPDNLLGYAGVFYTYATRAERIGKLAPGTAARWLSQLGPATADPKTFGAMFGEVAAAKCIACKDSLLVIGLRVWPQPDDALYADAEDAIARGVPDEALVFLADVKVQDQRYAALLAKIRSPVTAE